MAPQKINTSALNYFRGKKSVKLLIDLDNDDLLTQAVKYETAIDEARKELGTKEVTFVAFGSDKYYECQPKHVIPYFVIELTLIKDCVRYRCNLVIEKSTVYLVCITCGNLDKAGSDEDLYYLLPDFDKNQTKVRRFVGTRWGYGLSSRYELSPVEISPAKLHDAIIGFHRDDLNKLKDYDREQNRLELLFYAFPEAIRFPDIKEQLADCIKYYSTVLTKFDVVRKWKSSTKLIKKDNPTEAEVQKVKKKVFVLWSDKIKEDDKQERIKFQELGSCKGKGKARGGKQRI